MLPNLQKLLIFVFCLNSNYILSQEIWKERFLIPGKGIRGSSDGVSVQTDLSSVTTWDLAYTSVDLQNEKDYAMTVGTSGGRFEVCDIDGEVVWRSELIDVSVFPVVTVTLLASETGNGNNAANKYLKAFLIVDGGVEVPFSENGNNVGNWGKVAVTQPEVRAKNLQVVVKMANFYASDKVILDEVQVLADYNYIDPVRKTDVVINEIMINPFPGGEDFVELVNISDHMVFLDRLSLACRDDDGTLKQISRITGKATPFYPGEFVVATKDTNGVFPWYYVPDKNRFVQMNSFPSFPDDMGEVVLVSDLSETIDQVSYHKDMHNPFLADQEGISLERVSFSPEINVHDNWNSASEESGYATPGYKNSQTLSAKKPGKPQVTFFPEAFSPNKDGYNDEYRISYVMNKPGYLINVLVFDDMGRFIFPMFRSYTMGTSGILEWNGEDETGSRLSSGMYVIYAEIYHKDGMVYRFKDGVYLATGPD